MSATDTGIRWSRDISDGMATCCRCHGRILRGQPVETRHEGQQTTTFCVACVTPAARAPEARPHD